MHISVCITTFRRPASLKRLLQALQRQDTESLFTYSVVVIDDDPSRSAEAAVDEIKREAPLLVDYYFEGGRNMAGARNRAILCASGNLVAFIDDDEFPESTWLLNLYRTWRRYEVAGVLGPVLPHFEGAPPAWIMKSRVFERPRHATGSVLRWQQTRTGNVLLNRVILKSDEDLFDTRFRIHGEDLDFFKRLMAKGHRFVWCDSAIVFETQPPGRLRRRYHIRRALLRGSVAYTHAIAKAPTVLKSVIAVSVYIPALPLLHIAGHHVFMKYVIKTCDHIGKLLACCGYKVERHIRQL